jgi:hypothetical protein
LKYSCCDELRRGLLRKLTGDNRLNGIDYIEVLDDVSLPESERQRTLYLHFVNQLGKSPAPTALTPSNVVIDGGERIRDVLVTDVVSGTANTNVVTVTVNTPGDFSPYTLRLVTDADNPAPPTGIDPVLSSVQFSFKVGCPSDFDCKTTPVCPASPPTQPEINYLAKDYASFRQLMLDRMSLLMPGWKERNPADLGVALVELLAYAGDHLSYQQDAIATEAYLGTARRRVSVRRHARLVDYRMHDGCNARAWVQVQVDSACTVSKGARFVTRVGGIGPRVSNEELASCGQSHETFEAMSGTSLFPEHNTMQFYTWGDERCCLTRGATSATLNGHYPDLKAGDVLVFEEVMGPRTGNPADADPAHRHAVRLTNVVAFEGDGHLKDVLNGQDITEIDWAFDDALPFALCISSETDEEHGSKSVSGVSVALGNIVVADHGLTIEDEDLDAVPQPAIYQPVPSDADPCSVPAPIPVTPRFNPTLKEAPVTFAAPTPAEEDSAAAAMRFSPDEARAAVSLGSTGAPPGTWSSEPDLMNSDPDDLHFVVETENDGSARLRFGDDLNGQRPNTGTSFLAEYRVGNGAAGNVGAEAIAHIVSSDSAISAVRNPLPAAGGVEPESIEHVRQSAPYAFRTQERAVTAEDYAEKAQRMTGVQRAAATFRWTGSWYTVFLTIDRLDGLPVDDDFKQKLVSHMEKYRMAGYDLEIDGPRYVSLEIEMDVCVKPDHFRSDVEQALLLRLSNRVLPCGRRGLFHPDNFTFDQDVYLSPLYAEAQGVDGVAWVKVTKFQEQDRPETCALSTGVLELGRLEIARLDNDPSYPEHGVLRLNMMGGK